MNGITISQSFIHKDIKGTGFKLWTPIPLMVMNLLQKIWDQKIYDIEYNSSHLLYYSLSSTDLPYMYNEQYVDQFLISWGLCLLVCYLKWHQYWITILFMSLVCPHENLAHIHITESEPNLGLLLYSLSSVDIST